MYSVGNVIDADDAAPFVCARVRLHGGQVDQATSWVSNASTGFWHCTLQSNTA